MAMDKENSAAKQKQKIMLIATVVIIIFVAWQALKLMGGGSEATPTISAAPQGGNKAAATATAVSQGTAGANSNATPGAAAAGADTTISAPKPAPVTANAEISKIQQETQGKYVSALNELQMLKIQREIAETKQAITSSILANATAEKSITDLLTVQQAPVQSQYIAPPPTAEAPIATAPAQVQTIPATVTVKPENYPEVPYQISSVYYKGDKWLAVLTYQDKVFTVGVGDTLPIDNSTVASIDKNGVSLIKDKKTRKLYITAQY